MVGQRQAKKLHQLSEERIEKLSGIGFTWNPSEISWDNSFARLVGFRNEHGNCNVPQFWKDDRELARWVAVQRTAKRKGLISEERTEALQSIGFSWNTGGASWETSFAELKEFKRIHGHCNVPNARPESRRLAKWVRDQRRKILSGDLAEDRIKRLKDLCFVSPPESDAWEEMFAALVRYRRMHGDCAVPLTWSENPRLARWVWSQRRLKNDDKLSERRIKRLEHLDFIWSAEAAEWERMFIALVEYRRKTGHCNVPAWWHRNPALATWVSKQRIAHTAGEVSEDRIRRLREVGFQWELRTKGT